METMWHGGVKAATMLFLATTLHLVAVLADSSATRDSTCSPHWGSGSTTGAQISTSTDLYSSLLPTIPSSCEPSSNGNPAISTSAEVPLARCLSAYKTRPACSGLRLSPEESWGPKNSSASTTNCTVLMTECLQPLTECLLSAAVYTKTCHQGVNLKLAVLALTAGSVYPTSALESSCERLACLQYNNGSSTIDASASENTTTSTGSGSTSNTTTTIYNQCQLPTASWVAVCNQKPKVRDWLPLSKELDSWLPSTGIGGGDLVSAAPIAGTHIFAWVVTLVVSLGSTSSSSTAGAATTTAASMTTGQRVLLVSLISRSAQVPTDRIVFMSMNFLGTGWTTTDRVMAQFYFAEDPATGSGSSSSAGTNRDAAIGSDRSTDFVSLVQNKSSWKTTPLSQHVDLVSVARTLLKISASATPMPMMGTGGTGGNLTNSSTTTGEVFPAATAPEDDAIPIWLIALVLLTLLLAIVGLGIGAYRCIQRKEEEVLDQREQDAIEWKKQEKKDRKEQERQRQLQYSKKGATPFSEIAENEEGSVAASSSIPAPGMSSSPPSKFAGRIPPLPTPSKRGGASSMSDGTQSTPSPDRNANPASAINRRSGNVIEMGSGMAVNTSDVQPPQPSSYRSGSVTSGVHPRSASIASQMMGSVINQQQRSGSVGGQSVGGLNRSFGSNISNVAPAPQTVAQPYASNKFEYQQPQATTATRPPLAPTPSSFTDADYGLISSPGPGSPPPPFTGTVDTPPQPDLPSQGGGVGVRPSAVRNAFRAGQGGDLSGIHRQHDSPVPAPRPQYDHQQGKFEEAEQEREPSVGAVLYMLEEETAPPHQQQRDASYHQYRGASLGGGAGSFATDGSFGRPVAATSFKRPQPHSDQFGREFSSSVGVGPTAPTMPSSLRSPASTGPPAMGQYGTGSGSQVSNQAEDIVREDSDYGNGSFSSRQNY